MQNSTPSSYLWCLLGVAPKTSDPVKAGKLRALAVTSAKRSPAMLEVPEAPTIAEAGVSNAESGLWIALLAPGATPRGTMPAELMQVIAADTACYAKVIKAQDLKVE